MAKTLNTIKTLLFIGIVACVAVNFTMKPKTSEDLNRWENDESAWETAYRGDLVCLSLFTKENLSIKDLTGYELFAAPRDKYDKSQFFGRFGPTLPSVCLFPMTITVSDSYQETLSKEKYQELKKLSWLSKQYRSQLYNHKQNYYICTDIEYSDFKQIALYLYTDDDSVEHIFILPLNCDLLI